MRRRRDRSAGGPDPRRVPVVVVLVAMAVALAVGAVDDGARRGAPVAAATSRVPGSGVLDSTWYCPLGQADQLDVTEGMVRIASAAASPRRAVVVTRALDGRERRRAVELAPWSVVELAVDDLIDAGTVGVRVDISGPDVVVEHSVLGASGRSTAPCHDHASDTWHTAAGRTLRGDRLLLALYNPFPSASVAEITFSTDAGPARPRSLRSVLVEARSVRVVDVSEHVLRQGRVSATVTARSGRLVVDRLQEVSGDRRGTALAAASSAGAPTWWFPDAVEDDGVRSLLHLLNPGAADALVDVEVRSAVAGAASVAGEPRAVTVPAGESVIVEIAGLDGIEAGRPYALVVRTLSGPDVVAEREVIAFEPSSRRGRAVTLGATTAARRWVIADGRATESTDEWVVIVNPSAEPATVAVQALVGGTRLDIEGLEAVEVPARGRRAIRLGEHLRREVLALELTSDRPVVVQRDLYAVGAIGLSAVVPLADPDA